MYTYIVIDDESLIRKGTIKKLQPMEDRITCIGEADNGKAGIELIQEVHPDIVILDMQMPIMGGKELLPYLAENYPDMPLIVISGYRDFDYVKQAISAAAIDYSETIQQGGNPGLHFPRDRTPGRQPDPFKSHRQ